MKTIRQRKHGFTLIEMMVVIVIIVILAGIVFKLLEMANRDAFKAETVGILEALGHAIEEFRMEYGQYPPTTGVRYEFPNQKEQPRFLRDDFIPNNPNSGLGQDLFQYGLVSYLWPRARDDINAKNSIYYVPDTERDELAKKKWAMFLEPLNVRNRKTESLPSPRRADPWTGQKTPYTNSVEKLLDGWGGEIRYESFPPYMTYRLWSVGPDGADGTADDIHRDKWDD